MLAKRRLRSSGHGGWRRLARCRAAVTAGGTLQRRRGASANRTAMSAVPPIDWLLRRYAGCTTAPAADGQGADLLVTWRTGAAGRSPGTATASMSGAGGATSKKLDSRARAGLSVAAQAVACSPARCYGTWATSEQWYVLHARGELPGRRCAEPSRGLAAPLSEFIMHLAPTRGLAPPVAESGHHERRTRRPAAQANASVADIDGTADRRLPGAEWRLHQPHSRF